MSLNEGRKRVLRQLNSRYIYGRYPLLHALVAIVQLTMVAFLLSKFNASYAKRPILTTMITNAVLGGVADSVAQTLTAFKRRQQQIRLDPQAQVKDDTFTIEIQELGKKVPWPDLPTGRRAPPPFDFERLIRYMSYGFIMAPVQFKWFGFLNRTFPLTVAPTSNSLKRVAFDQLLFAPCGLAIFFTFMTVAEGGGRRAVTKKLTDVYVPTLKANYLIRPAVQMLNFRVMPIQFQIPFVSTIGIAWTAYLSLANSAEDEILASP